MNNFLVSVVVIGRNEGQRLVACLKSIKETVDLGGEIELIYVDSNSHDGSPELATSLGAKVISVQPLRPCAAFGRNAGWREAKAPNILFLDGDTLLHPEFLRVALKVFDDPNVAVVCGNRREIYPEQSLYNRALDLDWISPTGVADFCGGDALMRRDVLEQVGGFSEDLIAGEEPELCQRIRSKGYLIQHIDEPMTRHDLAITRFQAYWMRAIRTGHAYAEVSQRMKTTAFPLWVRECKRNAIHVFVLITLLLSTIVLSSMTGSFVPYLGLVLCYTFLVIRSAYRSRWKSTSVYTLMIYGVHSHLQQIPIACGQLSYWFNRFRNQKQTLIEYK